MSRTYRKKKENSKSWDTLEHWLLDSRYSLEEISKIDGVEKIVLSSYGIYNYNFYYSKTSKKGRQIIARWHSDAGVNSCKEPGPMWYVREFTQIPYRMRCKTALANYKKYKDYEVLLEDMPYLKYWT